jgi:hypothetical protein
VRADEREVLERAIRRVTEQAANADTIVDEAMAAGLDGSDRVVVGTKMLRAELLSVKADLERELERVLLNCVVCELSVATQEIGEPGRGRRAPQVRLLQPSADDAAAPSHALVRMSPASISNN